MPARRPVARALSLATATLLLAGCAGRVPDGWPRRPSEEPYCLSGCCTAPEAELLQVQYWGASGFRLERGGDVILLGPFFSNVSLLQASPLWPRTRPQVEVIHRYLGDVSDARAILVGHAHYDHLIDVPHIARHHAKRARIYASETAAHVLAADRLLDGRVEAVNDEAWYEGAPAERWIEVPGTRVRFLPILSEHAPHFHGQKFMDGHVHENRTRFPRNAWGWQEGQTLSYLIEFLGAKGEPDVRVYYQDASTNWRTGLPPTAHTPLDLALVCVASYGEVEGHPHALARHHEPRAWLLGHWEDFFRPYTQDPAELRTVPATDVPGFWKRLRASEVPEDAITLPMPGQHFRYQRCR